MDAGMGARQVPYRLILHFTHVTNLPGILAAGCIQADSLVDRASALRVEAGDPSVKARRKDRRIPSAPYGRVADYVPFYFAPRSPMLLTLAKGNVPTYQEGQDPLVYLVSYTDTAASTGLPCLFSDGNCASALTSVFNDLAVLESAVDWEIMTARMWANTPDDQDRVRRRMAEFLVHQRVPIACISQIVVRHETMKRQVETILAAHDSSVPVAVRPWWYFENV
jgi:ssDNA thymidine ADP-ribosyltransferase, DarT